MANSFAMKSLGTKVREFREHGSRRWSVGDLAAKVGTSRQNIENLERDEVALPHYIVKLADVMDCSIDDLLNRPSRAPLARMEQGVYRVPALDDALKQLGLALAAAPDSVRPALVDNLGGWARDRGAEHYREVLLMLLQRPHGKRSAGGHT